MRPLNKMKSLPSKKEKEKKKNIFEKEENILDLNFGVLGIEILWKLIFSQPGPP